MMNAVIPHFSVAVLSVSFWWNIDVFATTTTRPNIVFILADDLGYRDVGYHGSSVIETPTIDRLAYGGVRLENYYTQESCTPSRSSLLSGRYPIHTGLQHKAIELCQANSLPKEMPTLAGMLHDAGYATHMVGKWHLGHYAEEVVPTQRGFDCFFGQLSGMEYYYTHTWCEDAQVLIQNSVQHLKLQKLNRRNSTHSFIEKFGSEWCGIDLRENEDRAVNYSGQYSTHLFTEKATEVIRAHAEKQATKPLFLYLSYLSNHQPMDPAPEPYTKQYLSIMDKNRTIYAGMTACVDESVLNITIALEKYGLWNNTIVIFSTDNGGDTRFGGYNWPLRGEKGTLWEGGMKAIGLVHSPLIGHRAGTVSNGLIHINDWFPTLVALAGSDTAGLNLDAFDVWKTIADGQSSPRNEILHAIDPLAPKHGIRLNISNWDNRVRAAIRVGNWKLITGGSPHTNSWIAPPEDPHIHSVYDTDPALKNIWLFDIVSDPLEKTDLFESRQDIAVDLLNRLAEYQSTAVPVRYPKHDLRCNPKFHNGFWGPWRQLKNVKHQNISPPEDV